MATGRDHRKFPRYSANVPVIIYLGSRTVRGHIRQISRGGCLIFPPLPPQTEGVLRISFRLADEMPYVNCKGEPVYTVGDVGTGVAFTEISVFNQDLISEYFDKQVAGQKPAGGTAGQAAP